MAVESCCKYTICSEANSARLELIRAAAEGLESNRRNGAQKLLGVLITIGEAVAYVVSGMYGDVRELGAVNATLIILQVLVVFDILPMQISCLSYSRADFSCYS